MRTVFIICAILLAHYFEGYWINEQDRDPRYANRIISMNAAKAKSGYAVPEKQLTMC